MRKKLTVVLGVGEAGPLLRPWVALDAVDGVDACPSRMERLIPHRLHAQTFVECACLWVWVCLGFKLSRSATDFMRRARAFVLSVDAGDAMSGEEKGGRDAGGGKE